MHIASCTMFWLRWLICVLVNHGSILVCGISVVDFGDQQVLSLCGISSQLLPWILPHDFWFMCNWCFFYSFFYYPFSSLCVYDSLLKKLMCIFLFKNIVEKKQTCNLSRPGKTYCHKFGYNFHIPIWLTHLPSCLWYLGVPVYCIWYFYWIWNHIVKCNRLCPWLKLDYLGEIQICPWIVRELSMWRIW